jgi:hypothetical protein
VLATLEQRHETLANDLMVVDHQKPERPCLNLVGH